MWNRERIEQLIHDNVEESLSLEYKGAEALGKSDAKKAEIVRDVSALANSSGGILIYGVAEFQQREHRHRPEKVDPVDRKEFPKEWLEQIIQSIQPRIDGLVIEPVKIDNSSVCYVVTVPQSYTAHQARDHVYYRRHNFNVLPMEDYELRDVMNRRKRPKISASIFAARNVGGDGYVLVRLNNIGSVLAKDTWSICKFRSTSVATYLSRNLPFSKIMKVNISTRSDLAQTRCVSRYSQILT
jgi:predicted HTH transcriptional regulator